MKGNHWACLKAASYIATANLVFHGSWIMAVAHEDGRWLWGWALLAGIELALYLIFEAVDRVTQSHPNLSLRPWDGGPRPWYEYGNYYQMWVHMPMRTRRRYRCQRWEDAADFLSALASLSDGEVVWTQRVGKRSAKKLAP